MDEYFKLTYANVHCPKIIKHPTREILTCYGTYIKIAGKSNQAQFNALISSQSECHYRENIDYYYNKSKMVVFTKYYVEHSVKLREVSLVWFMFE